ncbi:3-mercaptopyruvate sulfurtransferase [Mesorhizobium sp. BE184]|uniref:3-mercaptopyruvate sulfurtransferase n=1 Tax=Mesorhizobium sp. BE184 TaxID=2817714 RepID=UPI0028609A66|nr:3-mercaptopyruvate sulfurtransferase [Mesorhizobium sp. BE184]MDR7032474.1 thiosulfate/3-mercaptopyruvate sulfurtransferase [Mesorhizobium sp. BE184]
MAEDSAFTVDADWLQQRLGQPGLTVVDGSWYLPSHKRDPRAEYETAHIPGALFLDQDAISDQQTDLPHMLAAPKDFAQYVGAMGISADDMIVVYDGPGYFSAPRAWWMFRAMGVSQVFVLDGGLDRWIAEGRPVTVEPTKVAPCIFHADFDTSHVVKLDEMRRIVDSGSAQIADARPSGRFYGTEPEPRPGVRSGHMPGAHSVPITALSENGELLSKPRLRALLEDAGLDLSKPIVTLCGSGITAAAINLALETLDHSENRLYDGSWTEWGRLADTPATTDDK